MAASLAQSTALYQKFEPWLTRYRGGMPAGFLAAIMQHESGGNVNSTGDASLGEVGLFQITATFPPSVGVPAEARRDPETNVFLASLEYQLEAIKMFLYAPTLVRLGTPDSWKLARLGFAIGTGGTRKLIDAAASRAQPGGLFAAVRAWCNATGGVAVSSGQDAAKVTARVNAVEDQWNIGQQIDGSFDGPMRIPARVPYTVPASLAPHFVIISKNVKILALAALAIGGVYLATRA